MGREIWVEIRKNGGTVWSSKEPEQGDLCFFGRNQETDEIARRVHAENPDSSILDITDKKDFDQITKELNSLADESEEIYNGLDRKCDDLLIARTHAATLADFEDFTTAYEQTKSSMRDERWVRARYMIEAMNRGRKAAYKLAKHEFWEDDADIKLKKSGLQLCWVCSE